MTDTCADEIISQAQPYLLSAEHNLMGTEFNAKIDAMEGLNAEEKKAFKGTEPAGSDGALYSGL